MTRAKELHVAYRLGREAFEAHHNAAANPYRPLNGPQADAWLDGWQAAQRDAARQEPLVKGGQGRTADDIVLSAVVIGLALLGCIATAMLTGGLR